MSQTAIFGPFFVMLALTLRITRGLHLSAGRLVALLYAPLSILRAFWRGAGFTAGLAAKVLKSRLGRTD